MQHLSFAMIGNKCSKLEKTNGWTFWCLKWLSLHNLWFIRLNALGDKDLSSNTNVLMLSREGKAKYLIKEYATLDPVLNCCCSKLFYFFPVIFICVPCVPNVLTGSCQTSASTRGSPTYLTIREQSSMRFLCHSGQVWSLTRFSLPAFSKRYFTTKTEKICP